MTKTIKGAVVGYGGSFNMGKAHAEQMMRHGIEFVAACDLVAPRREQAMRDFPHIRTFATVEELLAQGEIDLVTVITPHDTHYPLAEQILASGRHCVLEKPMCIRAEEADRLVKLARSAGKMLSVYHNRRWDGWYLTLRDLLARDILGELFHIEMFIGGCWKPKDWWRSDKAVSGGIFYDWGAHYIDYLLGVVPGKVTNVKGFIQNRLWHEFTNEDHMDSIITFENGATAHIQVSNIAYAGKPQFRFLGTKGAIVDENIRDGEMTLYTDINGVRVESKLKCQESRQDLYYRNIADHLMNGAELIVKPEEARRIISIIETTERSALQGVELAVPYEEPLAVN